MQAKKLTILTMAVALVFSGASFAQTALSLQESVEKAVTSNPELGARFQDFQSSMEGQNVAQGGLLPEVNAEGWIGKEWRGSTSLSRSHDWTRKGYTLQLRQLIFDGNSTLNTVRQLGLEKLSTYYDLVSTIDSVAMEAAAAHIDVQRYREMESLARENYQMHLNTLGQVRERSESGVGRGVDLEQAMGRQALAQSNLMTESGNLNDVLQRYRRIVGQAAPAVLVDAPVLDSKLPSNPENFDNSLLANPSILSKQALLQAADKGVDVARGNFSPTLELRASTGRDRNERPNEDTGRHHTAQASNVQLVASYNLYRGGADSARVRQTKAQSYAARDVRDYTCRNVQQELSIAWNNIVRLREQIPFLRDHELATSKVRVAYMQQFQIGQRSLLDLLDTENELFDARRALRNAEYDLKLAELRWLTFSHQLLPALGLQQPHDQAPEEADDLVFPQEALQVCMEPVPDTANLQPVTVEYRNNMQPPVLRQVSAN